MFASLPSAVYCYLLYFLCLLHMPVFYFLCCTVYSQAHHIYPTTTQLNLSSSSNVSSCIRCLWSVFLAVKPFTLLVLSLQFIIFCAHNKHIFIKHDYMVFISFIFVYLLRNNCFHFLIFLGCQFYWLVAVVPAFWSSSHAFWQNVTFRSRPCLVCPDFVGCRITDPANAFLVVFLDLPYSGVSRSSAWLVPANHPYSKNTLKVESNLYKIPLPPVLIRAWWELDFPIIWISLNKSYTGTFGGVLQI